MMTFFIDKKARVFVIYMCIGCFVCLLAGEINAVIKALMPNRDLYYITVNMTPVAEEILKTIPVLAFALLITDDKETLINISMVTGIGFAILENTYLLLNAEAPNLIWALIRGLGAGFMHGLSTLFVGFGLSYIRKKEAFLYPGIIGLLVTAIIFHSTYNALVQSDYPYLGYFYPMIVFVLVKYTQAASRRKSIHSKNTAQTAGD